MSRFAWYVKFPLSQYHEDVRSLAREKGLIVLNAKNQRGKAQADAAPKLTLKSAPPEPLKVPVKPDVNKDSVNDTNNVSAQG